MVLSKEGRCLSLIWKDSRAVQIVSYLPFLPPYFLKSVYQEMKEKNETKTTKKLSGIFKKVWDQLMGESLKLDIKLEPDLKTVNQELLPVPDDDREKLKEKEYQKAVSTSEDEREKVNQTWNQKTETIPDIKKNEPIEELQNALIRALLFAVDSEKINSTECAEMIKDTKVPDNDLEKFLDSYMRNTSATTKIAFGLLEKTLKEKMIRDEAYINLYCLFVTPKKGVTFDDFMKHIKKLLEDQLISERCFEKKVTEFIKGGGAKQKKKKSEEINVFSNYWDGNQWIIFVTSLLIHKRPGYEKVPFKGKEVVLTDNVIGNSLRMTLFQCVVSTYKMKKKDVSKAIKDVYAIKKNEREPLLESVKFK